MLQKQADTPYSTYLFSRTSDRVFLITSPYKSTKHIEPQMMHEFVAKSSCSLCLKSRRMQLLLKSIHLFRLLQVFRLISQLKQIEYEQGYPLLALRYLQIYLLDMRYQITLRFYYQILFYFHLHGKKLLLLFVHLVKIYD